MAQIVTAQPGTTVVVQQTQVLRDWNSGVFACLDDIGSCKLTIFLISFLSFYFLSIPRSIVGKTYFELYLGVILQNQ